MKKKLFLPLFILLLLNTNLTSCIKSPSPNKETANAETSLSIHLDSEESKLVANKSETLLRADPRFIAWLEKVSLVRQSPQLLSIVSGNSLAWRAPSLIPEKENILARSPAWFYANPWKIITKNTTHLGEFLNATMPKLLKQMGINALFFTPTAPFSLNQELGYKQEQTHISYYDTEENIFPSQEIMPQKKDTKTNANIFITQKLAPEYNVVGFGIDEQVASKEEYKNLERTNMLIGGSILEPALGIGADFLLALRAVREYSGLFIMTELPQHLWNHIPESNIENTFSYTVLNHAQKTLLAQHGLIPPLFARDLIPSNFQTVERDFSSDSDFAVTGPIRGVDSAKRRWIYRFAQDPKRPLLNLSDPNMNAHKLFSASIVEQIGLLHQPLISVSIGDLWGQESTYITQNNSFSIEKAKQENDIKKLNSYLQQFAEPALFTLSIWNKIIHNYGAWSIIEDAFPLEFLPILIEEKADFVADTIFMPPLEQAFLTGNTLQLKNNVQRAIDLQIDCTYLWHASQDRYQKQVFNSYFKYPSSMALACDLIELDINEGKFLAKFLQTQSKTRIQAKTTENLNNFIDKLPNELAKKLQTAQNIQFAFLSFQSLLPGLSFISAYDIQGVVPITTENNMNLLPEFTLSKKQENEENRQAFMLNSYLETQINEQNSLANNLKALYEFKQKEELAHAQLISVLETDDTYFAILLQTPSKKYFALFINPTNKKQNAKIKINPTNFSHNTNLSFKTRFTQASEVFKNTLKTIHNNAFSISVSPYECRLFELK